MNISAAFNAPYDVPQLVRTEPIAGATPPRGKTTPGFITRVETQNSSQMPMAFPPELTGQCSSDVWAKFISEFNMLQNARQSTEPDCVESCGVCLFCCLCPCCGGCSKYEEFNRKQAANVASFRNQLAQCVNRWNEQTFRNLNLAAHLGFELRHMRKIVRGQEMNGQREPDREQTWNTEYAVLDVAYINPPAPKIVMSPMSMSVNMPMMPNIAVTMPHVVVSGPLLSPSISINASAGYSGLPLGFPLCLRNAHGRQLGATDRGGLVASGNEAGWEQFVLEDAGPGHVFISCPALNVRLTAKDDRRTVGLSPNRSSWERWQLTVPAPGKLLFTSAHGMQLSQSDKGDVYQSPNRDAWETFTVIPKGTPGHMLQPPGVLL